MLDSARTKHHPATTSGLQPRAGGSKFDAARLISGEVHSQPTGGGSVAAERTAELPGTEPSLLAGSVSPLATLFQSITFMAPAGAIVFSLSIAVPLAGNALPISILIAGIACILTAVAIGQLASEVPSAGGLYSYAATGLGPKWGFAVGWLYVGVALFFPPFVFLVFGWFIETTLKSEHLPTPAWWVWSMVCVALTFALTYFGVRLSTNSGIILGSFELLIFGALSVTMIAHGPNSTAAFSTSGHSTSGLFQGAVFGILAFTGFEVASTLGEEARNPRRTVKYSIVFAALLVGAYFVFCSYAWVVGAKFDIVNNLKTSGGNPWNLFGHRYWGAGWVLVFLAILNSIIANGVASVNNAGRVLLAMGRAGAAPSVFARVHTKYRTPSTSIIVVLAVSVLVTLLAGWKFGIDVAWGVTATIFTVFAILIYMICCLACISFFTQKEGRSRLKPWLHVAVPAGGLLVFVLPLYAQYFDLGELFSGKFKLTVTYPFNWADYGALIWIGIGALLTVVLARRRPEALSQAGRAFAGATESDGVPAK